MVMEVMSSPEDPLAVKKPLFQGWEFCPENILFEEDLLIFHLPTRITVYSLDSKEFLREIHFPYSAIHVWCIWKEEMGPYYALTDRGIFSFSPESGKCSMDRIIPDFRWIHGIQVEDKILVLVKDDLSLHKWSPRPEDPSLTVPLSEARVARSNKKHFLLDGNPELIAFVEESFKGDCHLHIVSSSGKWSTGLDSPISCLSVHPSENKVATGDKTGRIFLWSPLADGSYTQTLFHWHSSTVCAIAWSHDSILSGGREEVLIKWSFHHKNCIATVPRLGGTILNVFIRKEFAFLSLSNNSLQIYERTGLTKKSHFAGPDFESISNYFTWFEPYESLVFSNAGTILQFINPRTRKEIIRLEIVQENRVTSIQNKKSVAPTLHFDISSDYKWLATARKDDQMLKLSIWKFSLENINPFSLTAQWTEPQCFKSKVAIKFIQSKQQLIVLGTENAAKLWQIDSTSDSHYWIKSFTYKNHFPSAVSSSEDGSVLAIAFKNTVTLWRNDGVHYGLITSLSNESLVKSLLFGRGRNAGVLFSSTESRIFVWDVLHMKLRRKIPFAKPMLVSTPDKRIAVKDNKGVFVYDADGMRSKIYNGRLESIMFSSSSSGAIHCYYLTHDGIIGRIKWNHKEEDGDREEGNKENLGPDEETPGLSIKSSLVQFKTVHLQKETFSKDPSLFFENVQFPLSAFAIDFLDKGVTMFKNTFLYE